MRTRMMAAAEPGEDLAGLPSPQEVAPVLLRLVTEGLPSGRYTAQGLGVTAAGAGAGEPAAEPGAEPGAGGRR
ncbi:hypothetical protein [Streptomyces sp. MT206]